MTDMLAGKVKCEDFVWKKLIQRLYPEGNVELVEKMQGIVQERK
jgi:hypothetical protein